MSLHWIDWTVIVVFLGIILLVGVSFAKKGGKSITSFFLGDRNLPWYLAGISMVATTFAADTPLAVTELVGQYGIAGNWIWWNALAGGMLTTFFFANLWRKANVLTEVELIEKRYSGKKAAFLRGFKALYLGVFLNVIIIGWVNLALASLIEVFFSIDHSTAIWITGGIMVLVALYASIAGFLGIAFTDMIQFFIAIAGCIILAILVVNSDEIGGIESMKRTLNANNPGVLNFLPTFGAGTGLETYTIGIASFFAFIGIQWWSSWSPGAEPGGGGYIAQRMMSTKNEKHAVGATLFFQIAHYCIRPWPWILVGLAALVLYPDLGVDDKKLGYVMAMKDFLPTGLKGLLLVAFLAAYMSTISTQLNWGASYIVNDVYKRFINNTDDQKKLVLVSRIVTVLLMIIGLGVTFQLTTIESAWLFIMECGAGLGLVLILRWYWWRINAWSEIVATIAPFLFYTIGLVTGLEHPTSFFFTVGGTTISWLLVTFITQPTDNKTLSSFYQTVQPDGWWRPFQTNMKRKEGFKSLGILLICWISGIVFTYGSLFLTGKLILQELQEIIPLSIAVVLSGVVLYIFIKKTKIFNS